MIFKKREREPKNIKEVLRQFQELEKKVEETSQKLEFLEKSSKLHIQKIGLIRYNPFSNVGGNQSFSIAVLNKKNDGFVITSLYAQDSNRIYAKSVKNGKSEYSLSEEEEKAITEAIS